MKPLRNLLLLLFLIGITVGLYAQTQNLREDFLGLIMPVLKGEVVTTQLTFNTENKRPYFNSSYPRKEQERLIRSTTADPKVTFLETGNAWKVGADLVSVYQISLQFNPDVYFITNRTISRKVNFSTLASQLDPGKTGRKENEEGIVSYTNGLNSTIFNCQEIAVLQLNFTAEKNNDYEVKFFFDVGTIGPNDLMRTEKKVVTFQILGKRIEKDGSTVWIHPALMNDTFFNAIKYGKVDYPTPVNYYTLTDIEIIRVRGTSQINFGLGSLIAYYIPSSDWEVYYKEHQDAENINTVAGTE
jgi:hypothetical protein